MKMDIEKKISTTKENREFLMKVFGVTERMVFKALAFQSDTELARKIRHLALQRGGFLLSIGPDFETIHDCDGYMRQHFKNGAMLEFDKEDGQCDAFFGGEHVKHWDQVMLKEIGGIQSWVSALK